MSEQVVQVADAATPTKNMRTIQQTAGGNTVQSEVVVLATGAANGGDTYDARQIRALTSSDIVTAQPVAPASSTGSINGTGQSVSRTLTGGNGVAVTLAGTWNGGAFGLFFYGSADGVTFTAFSAVIRQSTFVTVSNVLTSANNGVYILPSIAGLKSVQVSSLSTWTSGTANITITETSAPATNFPVTDPLNNKFPNAAALADSTSNPTLTQLQVFPMVWNGTSWDRLTGFGGGSLVAYVYGGNGAFFSQDASNNMIVTQSTNLGANDKPDVTVNQSGTLKVAQQGTVTVTNPNIPVLSTDARGDLNVVNNQLVQIPKQGWGPGWGNFTGW